LKTVAHCATPYPFAGGSWIYNQLAYLRRYRPVVLTQLAQNRDEFPLKTLYTAEEYPALKQWLNRAGHKLTGQYWFYEELMRREEAALIHAHFGHQGGRVLRAKRRTGLPLVTTFYGYDVTCDPYDRRWKKRYAQLFDSGECFLVEGGTMKERLIDAGGPPERIRVHHLGVDVERIPFKRRFPTAEIRFLICSPFREKKGIPDAIRALGIAVRQRPFAFVLVLIGGAGPEGPKIEAAIKEAGIDAQVERRGMQPYAKVIEALQECHILLQASRTAVDGDTEGGAPFILLDAQAAGMPVVSTQHADIPEVVAQDQSGLLAPEGDLENLAAHIRWLVENPQRWAAMGEAGRKHIETDYNAKVQCARLEDLYDEFA
jgi:colanic acid/amylovoran biosynthesis glycosyltransferase